MIKKKNIPIIFLLLTCMLAYGSHFSVSNVEFASIDKTDQWLQEFDVVDNLVKSENAFLLSRGMTGIVELKPQLLVDNYDTNNREWKDLEVYSVFKISNNLLYDG